MKEKIAALFLLMIFILAGCGGQQSDSETDISVPVSVEEIKLKPIEEFITATGTVNAIEEAILKAETAGFYQLLTNPNTNRPYALGDFVEKDCTIIRLENPELVASARIESRKLSLEVSEQEYNKQRSLYEKGGVTYSELKSAETAYMNAKYEYDNALIQLQKLEITAPFSGIIVDLPYYTPGVKIETGARMAQLMNYKKLYMEVNLPGKSMDEIKIDQPVRVMNYTMPDDTLSGKIMQVSPALDPDTRSFKSTIEIKNPELLLRPGMFTKAEIVVAQKDSAIVIPKDIILSKRRGKTVFIVEKGAADERTISTGLENPEYVEVTDGLKENERLVIKGFETLRNRSKVKIVR